MPSKVWDEITYPFPNFNSATSYNGRNNVSILGLKLNRISEGAPDVLSRIRNFSVTLTIFTITCCDEFQGLLTNVAQMDSDITH